MDTFIGHIIFVIFFAVSSLSVSDTNLESEIIDANVTEVLSPLSRSETYLRRGALPPPHHDYDFQGKPTREYRLEDFMWTGSGNGPIAAESDGLAWDDGDDHGGDGIIRITKTFTLYSTVLTTMFPVELTPTVIFPTPLLSDSSSILESSHFLESSFHPITTASSSQSIGPTSIYSTANISPTPTMPGPSPTSKPPSEQIPSAAPDIEPGETPSASTNKLYWVNTVIKANGSEVHSDSPDFQGPMQTKLARVYASAFRRHLLSALGILNNKDGTDNLPPHHRRRRRSTRHLEREDLDFEWLFLKEGMTKSQIQSLATTNLNISVSIVNITPDPSKPRVSMDYIVSAEGNPISGSSAVQDLDLVTKSEMEQEIGYEVIKKAEALVSQPSRPREMSLDAKEADTSPWLMIAIGAICAFLLSCLGLTYMAWKSKHTAISDDSPKASTSRAQPGIEAGVINPAFLGSPGHMRSGRYEEVLETSRISARRKETKEISSQTRPDSAQLENQKSLASELTVVLSKNGGGKTLPSTVKNEAKYSSGGASPEKSSSDSGTSQDSRSGRRSRRGKEIQSNLESEKAQTSQTKEGSTSSATERDSGRRRKRKSGETSSQASESSPEDKYVEKSRPLSASRDKVTLGHLDLCEDSVVRSDKSKKSKSDDSKSGSGTMRERKKSQSASSLHLPETIDEVSDLYTTTDGAEGVENTESLEERDRKISESRESPRAGPSSRDAQVQTPTRSKVKLKTKVKPKPRTSRPSRLGAETMYMTESEEFIDTGEESTNESNPLGRMRKRFHQFLDDAFNVMGNKDPEDGEGEDKGERPKTAKVSISHQVEKRESQSQRPWTTHVIHEESVEQRRPKSATIRPPMKAWTDSSDRRCHSAKSDTSTRPQTPVQPGSSRGHRPAILEKDELPEESDLTSSSVPTTTSEAGRGIARSTIPIFPNYPIYPDIPILQSQPGSSQPSTDPAVPLIQAIKEEIKRLEKAKAADPHRSTNV